jgi:sialic acid synthase SpsE
MEGRKYYRLSCAAARDLSAGYSLTSTDISFKRPGTGFPPKKKESLIGRSLVNDVGMGHIFESDDFK